jgi:pimeloyl-ACP methyl ester carboxylesterase
MAKYPGLVVLLVLAGAIGNAQTAPETIVPFRIAVPEPVLTDLHRRLENTRFPSQIDGAEWDYGTDLSYMRELVQYWRHRYDWRAHEQRLNALPQFKTAIDGLQIHFVHHRSRVAGAKPLVLIHGWPGSVVEFTKIIDRLTDPGRFDASERDAFHVVALSLPGFGFSDKPTTRGMSPRKIAEIVSKLMARLGYERYGAQGGDWGGVIVRQLGLLDRTRLIGVHSNMCVAPALTGPAANDGVPAEELKRIESIRDRMATEIGYQQIQSTKPMTLGYGLNDSPVGLAAWIIEKFRTWSDSKGDIESRFSKDELLTNIMIYWVTETGPSSARIYFENRVDPGAQGRVEVPFACARFPGEVFANVPRKAVEAAYNLVQYTEMPSGGHFAAFEEPELLAQDVRKFFRDLK